jgi:hypothetical protein
VLIFRQNYFEGPHIEGEEPTSGYPPRDHDGIFYYAAYVQSGAIRGLSNVYGSIDEAARAAERTIQGSIVWQSEAPINE